MSGNYKSGFRRYKRNLRWKSNRRKASVSGPPCEECGTTTYGEEYGWRCPRCGKLHWDEPNPNFKVNPPPFVRDDRPGEEFGYYER